jgi:translation elongation factor P/translation initiation factor 5A
MRRGEASVKGRPIPESPDNRVRPALHPILEFMVLIDAIDVKRRTRFEMDNTPFSCLEVEVNTPTARGGQTLVRLKIRNLITNAVFERTFKAGEKFKEPDLQTVPASYLYSDSDGSYFLDQDSYETLTLAQVQWQPHRLGIASVR